MTQALSDFRIENDSLIALTFADGREEYVKPSQLEQYLVDSDLMRVTEALNMRKQFMRRVLPPTAMFMLLISVLGLGAYDASQLSQRFGTQSPPTVTDLATFQAVDQMVHPQAVNSEMPRPAVAQPSQDPVQPEIQSTGLPAQSQVRTSQTPQSRSIQPTGSGPTLPSPSATNPQSITAPVREVTKSLPLPEVKLPLNLELPLLR